MSPGSSLALGKGYAKKQLSDDGDRAHNAFGFGDVEIVNRRFMLRIS